MIALAFALTMLGLAALALAMDRHASHLPHALAGQRLAWALRVLGATALACALLMLSAAIAWSQGLLLWLGLLTPATLCVAAAMAWLGRRRRGK